MAVAKIIWVDDEIESLESQKLFLENKGYEVQTFTNGFDAIDYVKENPVDVVMSPCRASRVWKHWPRSKK
jgi:response regulator RpfG family c-di-GMP phosphodiesterase